jgi:exopolyphosphatase/guanosine-5'-triphosphate,3'-diphosphate pyrophosphatase
MGLTTHDSAQIHNSVLSAGALRHWIDLLLDASPPQRRALVVASPDRADTLLAGACILLSALEITRRQAWRVSTRGLRFGAIGL